MTKIERSNNQALVFEVAKQSLHKTRVINLNIEQPLAENEVLLKVDKFALTANNISYGIAGDALGYWQFFPTENKTDYVQWGRLPVMGFADVISSNCAEIKVGERVWGFMPMATHVKILAGKVSTTGFSDVSSHREGLSPIYSKFDRVNENPFYQPKDEDYDILLRGLFTTSWLVDDFMFDNNYFGSQQYLITSASSKTSIALAFTIKQRGERPTVGITSNNNCDFVKSLGCYDQVISYEDISNLDASIGSVLVDMAGGQKTLSTIHHHFAEKLFYSCRIGATQHNDININNNVSDINLPGAKPEFFFAPTQLQKRIADWGASETMKQMNMSLHHYITFCRSVITINHTKNIDEVDVIYQQVLAGKADAAVGQIISL